MSYNQSYQAAPSQGQLQHYVGCYPGTPSPQKDQQGYEQTPHSGPPQGPYVLPGAEQPLPQGWIKEWNAQHNAWFYVNTLAQPPQSQWTHPGPSQPSQYLPPPGPPPLASYTGNTSTPNNAPPTYSAAPVAFNGTPTTIGDNKLGNREGKGPNEFVSQGYGPPPAGPLPSGPFLTNTHASPPLVNAEIPSTNAYAPPFSGAQTANIYAAPAAIYGSPPTTSNAPGNGCALVAQKAAAAPAVPAATKPKSGLLGAGLGALGGLALGAFATHEWNEHERREDQKEEKAYEAGILAGSYY